MRPFPVMAAMACAVLVAGCAGKAGNRPGPVEAGEAQLVILTSIQLQAIQGGVKQMIANPDSARFSTATAVTLPGQPGVHACGHVRHKDGAGRYGAELPYYLELRDKEGKPVPERGQVGTDDAKRSKITFMCRHHKPG